MTDVAARSSLAKSIAERVADENAARARLAEFAESVFGAIESLVPEFESAGSRVSTRRVEVEESLRLELFEAELHEGVLFMTQHNVAYVLQHPAAHAALYAFIVSDVSGQAVPVERFLISKSGDVHCEGICAPLEAMPPVPLADLAMPRLKGQRGFRPRTTLLPPTGVRSSR